MQTHFSPFCRSPTAEALFILWQTQLTVPPPLAANPLVSWAFASLMV